MARFIKSAIKHKGSLHAWAKRHHFLTHKGTINLAKARRYAKRKGLKHRVRQINLARTLNKVRR